MIDFAALGQPAFSLWVDGIPVAKQSFVYTRRSGGYSKEGTVAWESTIKYAAYNAWPSKMPIHKSVCLIVSLGFFVPHLRHRDVDNLAKAVLDGLKHTVFEDDDQVIQLLVSKDFSKERPGVAIRVWESGEFSQFNTGGQP